MVLGLCLGDLCIHVVQREVVKAVDETIAQPLRTRVFGAWNSLLQSLYLDGVVVHFQSFGQSEDPRSCMTVWGFVWENPEVLSFFVVIFLIFF